VDRPHADECLAKVEFDVGGITEEFDWNEGAVPNAALKTVHVFDHRSGSSYLVRENDVKYMPAGMDVLSSLADLIAFVGNKLKQEDVDQTAKINQFDRIFVDHQNTKAHELISNLDKSNALEIFEKISALSDVELARKLELEKQIPIKESKSPASIKKEMEVKIPRLNGIHRVTKSLMDVLSEDNITRISGLAKDAKIAGEAAEKAKGIKFEDGKYISGTGDGAWLLLWNAAKSFSEEKAYHGHEFPNTDESAKCVLCQQNLGPVARKNLNDFDDFVKDKSQELSKSANVKLKDAIDELELVLPSDNYISAIEENISIEDYADVADIKKALQESKKILNGYITTVKSQLEVENIDELTVSKKSLKKLHNTIETLETEIAKPLDDQKYEEAIGLDKKELSGLRARLLLYVHEQSIRENIKIYEQKVVIKSASGLSTTGAVSTKIGSLSNEFVITALADEFNKELKNMFAGKIKAELVKARTERGVPYSEIVITGTTKVYKGDSLEMIMSEGEQRGVALAGFFAELSISPVKSAIVFDDPVTSLDHLNLEKIAKRVAKESLNRQVIVFTHNILFASELENAAGEEKAEYSSRAIEKFSTAGIVREHLDFDNMKTKGRINYLEQQVNPLKAKHLSGDASYKDDAGNFYRDLRLTWERAIEEILLNGIVQRYRRDVKPGSINAIIIHQDDKDLININMERCAKFLHDQSDETNGLEIPDPSDIVDDLSTVKTWVAKITTRKNRAS
jgi:hemerythrin superfamily protein